MAQPARAASSALARTYTDIGSAALFAFLCSAKELGDAAIGIGDVRERW
jgi:hypothetical protein